MKTDLDKIVVIRVDTDTRLGLSRLRRMIRLAHVFRENNFTPFILSRYNEIASCKLKSEKLLHNFCTMPGSSEKDVIDFYCDNYPDPILWIIDNPFTPPDIINYIKKKNIPVVCFDNWTGGLASDLTFNQLSGWNTKPIHEQVVTDAQYLITATKRCEHNIVPKISNPTRIGVYFGSADTAGDTFYAAIMLNKIVQIEVDFFFGPYFFYQPRFNNMVDTLSYPFRTNCFEDGCEDKLAECDVIICGGGQQFVEVCSLGPAVLAMTGEKNERRMVEDVEAAGGCLYVGDPRNEIYSAKVESFINELTVDPAQFVPMRESACRLFTRDGAERCFEKINGILK